MNPWEIESELSNSRNLKTSELTIEKPAKNNVNMPSTTTTSREEDLSALQSDIRLMEIADDPAEFRNFLPGYLRGGSSTRGPIQ